MIVKFICKKDWHGIGDYYYGKIYNGYPCEKEQKGYDMYDDNHVPTFCDEDFINEYFNIVTEEKQGEQKSADKVKPIVVRDFNSVFSREQIEEIDKRIEESQRLYNAKLIDAMQKVKDFPMTN